MELIYMMKYLVKIYKTTKKPFKNKKNYLHLNSVYKKDSTICCEFNELLQLNGELIKFNIEEIANNLNIQKSIFPKTLFIIGVICGKYQNSLSEFRVKVTDIKNNTVTLENSHEKTFIGINDLLYDESLIQQINSLDLMRLIFPYAYNLGYNARSSFNSDSMNMSDTSDQENSENLTNIVNLF